MLGSADVDFTLSKVDSSSTVILMIQFQGINDWTVETLMAVDYQTLLDRRAEIAEEITQTISSLGSLLRQEVEVQDKLRRLGETAGVKANPFQTASTVQDAINSELTRSGLPPRRSDPRMRLTALVVDQNRRYASQRQTRAQVTSQSAA
jgi:hypothetical protein